MYMYMYKGMGKDGPKCGYFFVKSPLKILAKMTSNGFVCSQQSQIVTKMY